MDSNSDVTASLERRKTSKSIDWSKVKGEEFFKDFEGKKKRMLYLIGISNWTADNYRWSLQGKYYQLDVNGSYTDSLGQRIAFTEVHIYKANETVQILHTRPSSTEEGKKLSEEIISYIKGQAE